MEVRLAVTSEGSCMTQAQARDIAMADRLARGLPSLSEAVSIQNRQKREESPTSLCSAATSRSFLAHAAYALADQSNHNVVLMANFIVMN